jgi:hypothetical protein
MTMPLYGRYAAARSGFISVSASSTRSTSMVQSVMSAAIVPAAASQGGNKRSCHANRQWQLHHRICSLLDDDAPDVAFLEQPLNMLQQLAALGANRFHPASLSVLGHPWPPLYPAAFRSFAVLPMGCYERGSSRRSSPLRTARSVTSLNPSIELEEA